MQITRFAPEAELEAAFARLLRWKSFHVTSRFYKTTYFEAQQEGAPYPVPFVFVFGPVESRGSFSAPGTFQIRQTVDPPYLLTQPGVPRITVEKAESLVAVKDGAVQSAASTGLASVLTDSAPSGDLLVQFLAISLTGGARSGGLAEFLTFKSARFVQTVWEEVGADRVIEARRDALSGGIEVWRFALNRSGNLQRISFAVRPPPVSIVSGRFQTAPARPADLTFVAPPFEMPAPQIW